MEKVIGVISDTHGLLRKEVFNSFRKCDLILHAGDIDDVSVLQGLQSICPVIAVKGNCDRGAWTKDLKRMENIEYFGLKIVLIHGLPAKSEKYSGDIVIYGHSHKPKINYYGEVLYFNPGSAGPLRFSIPPSVGIITWKEERITPEIIYLDGS